MSSPITLVDPLLVERLGWTLVHFAWQGLLVGAVTAWLLRVLRGVRPQLRYALACTSLLVMLVAPLSTFAILYSTPDVERTSPLLMRGDATLAAPASNRPTSSTQARVSDRAKARVEAGTAVQTGTTVQGVTAVQAEAFDREHVAAAPLSLTLLTRVATSLLTVQRALPWLVALWFVGVALLLVRLLGGIVLLGRLTHRTRPAREDWQLRLVVLARKLHVRRAIALRESLATHTPAVIGWLRPVILMPASVLAGLSPEQIEAILAHELAHVRRHDYVVNLLQSVAETLLFYHPAVWLVSRQIRIEREHCCDDVAVAACGDAVTYASALADLERLRGSMPMPALAATGGPLLRRVQRVLTPTPQPSFSWPAAVTLVLTISTLALVTLHGDEPTQNSRSTRAAGSPATTDRRQPVATPTPAPAATQAEDDELEALFTQPAPPAPPAAPSASVAPVPSPAPLAVAAPAAPPAPPTPEAFAEPAAPAPAPRPAPAAFSTQTPAAPSAPPAPPRVADAPHALEAPAAPPAPPRVADAPHALEAPAAPPAPPRVAGAPRAPQAPPSPASPASPASPPSPPSVASPAAAPAPPAPPAPPPPPARSARSSGWFDWLWGGEMQHSSYSMSDNGRKISVISRGAVELTDDDNDIKQIEAGGYFKVEERVGTSRRRVDLRSDGSQITRRWLKNGAEADYDAEAKQWLSRVLLELSQRTGLGAEKRIARILAQRGPGGLLDASTKIESSYVKKLYLTGVFSAPGLDTPTMQRALQETAHIESDYERAEVLRAAAQRGLPSDETRLTYVQATQTIGSDYERQRTLDRLIETPVSEPVLTAVIASGAKMQSDYHLASLLHKIAERQTLGTTSSAQFVEATRSLQSDYEHRRALMPFAERQTLSPDLQKAVIASAMTMQSDFETVELLRTLVSHQALADAARPAFFTVVGRIQSDFERGRVLKAFLATGGTLSEAAVKDVLTATLGMSSDFERANVLTELATRQPLAGASLQAFMQTAEAMSSQHERDRALVSLVRRGNQPAR